ncbi:MAG: DUF2127 domain-containing protein [Thermoanaerobaculia bacterium]
MKRRSDRVLRLIAIFRFAKAILFIASGLAALKLVKPGAVARFVAWLDAMPFATQHAFVQHGIEAVTRMTPRRIEELAIVAFLYAALFITEGTGLWMGKIWAEWLTIVATTSFIPFEIYEVVHKITALRVAILLLNIVIVVYLVYRRRTSPRNVA